LISKSIKTRNVFKRELTLSAKKELIKLAAIYRATGNTNYQKLLKIALSFNYDKAKDQGPKYWQGMGLDKYEKQIRTILNGTQAPVGSEEFVSKVLNFQRMYPASGVQDGILGPETFKAMKAAYPDLLNNAQTTDYGTRKQVTHKEQILLNQQGKSLQELIDQYGLVSLEGLVPYKNSSFVRPEIKSLVKKLLDAGAPIDKVSEAFPPSSPHRTPGHYNGGAIDFTLSNPSTAQKIVDYINSLPKFKALNEYAKNYGGTAGHIHVHLKDESLA
jgi:hypothetical protein